jgi:long-chain alkane monooxygenase
MKRIHLNAFKMAGVGHTAIGLWRHPDNQASRYKDLDYWIETAKTLERGKFDSLFIADFPGIYDTYKRSPDAALKDAIAVPLNDPLLAVSAMAAATRHLGFGITVSTTYEQPYSFARKMTTLDHLTKGRIGWNIVTSATESAARNLGLDQQVPHDERYRMADEFMEVVYKLWEGSWEDDAVVMDRDTGVYVDPAKVHAIGHHGKYYKVPDPFLCEPSPQRTPTLFQAGASSAGKAFAAKHAEAIFLVDPTIAGMAKFVKDVRALAAERGRDPASLKFMAGVSIVTAPTDEEAEAKFRDLIRHISVEGTLARQSALMQLDFGSIDIDKPLEYVETDGIRSFLERFTKNDPNRVWTPRQVAEKMAQSLGALTIVGSPGTVADRLEAAMEEADLDGFNLYDHMPLSTMPDFVDLVVPELQRRGRVWSDYAGATLREHISETGDPHLAADHGGVAYRGVTARAAVSADAA